MKNILARSAHAFVGTVLILLVGLALTILATARMAAVDEASADDLFRTVKSRMVGSLQEHVTRYGDALRGLRSAAVASGGFDQARLEDWVNAQQIGQHYPALRLFGFARAVQHDDLPAYLKWLAARETEQKVVYKPLGNIQPQGESVVVEMLAPSAGNQQAIGYELSSEPRRAQGIDTASITGEPSLSESFQLVLDKETVYGMFLATDLKHEPAAPRLRDGLFKGYFFTLVYTKWLFGDLEREYQNLLDFELVDQGVSGEKAVYTSSNYLQHIAMGHDHSDTTLVVGGRVLLLRAVATTALHQQMYKRSPWQAAALLSMLTVLVAWAWWRLTTDRARIHARAEALSQRNVQLLDDERRLRQTVEASSRDYRALFETVQQHAIVSEADGQGRILTVNDAFVDVSGYQRAELIGQDHRILNSGVHSKIFWTEMWRSLHAGRSWRAEVCNRRKDGTIYWVDSMVTPFMNERGRLQRCVSVRLNITDRILGAEALREAKEQAENASRYKSQFLANMSHEIRTPMNAVLGMLQLLKTTPLQAPQLDYASKAESAAKSLLGILNDILDFSKVEAGKMQLDPNPFDFDQMMKDLGVVLTSNLGHKRLEVLFDLAPDIPQVLIGDELRLRQVLINLAGNAIKFTPQGEVIVRVRVAERNGDTAHVSFSVEDTGIGISQQHQEHIFEGFRQAEASTSRQYGGTGLGLSICRRLVALMGGEMKLESTPGVGSTFSFTLPFVVPETPEAAITRPQAGPDYLNLRTLVIEDNLMSQVLMVNLLGSLGWRADKADSGTAALALIEQELQADHPYDAVFLDWDMPDKDGWATQAAIAQLYATQAPHRQAPIFVMVTGHGTGAWEQLSPEQRQKIDAYLPKPVTASSLYNAVAGREGLQISSDKGAVEHEQPLTGMVILLVEDNPINQQVAQELLTQQGAQVVVADNGRAAVEYLGPEDHGIDVVLMDMQMPVMDGLQATHVIREILKRSDLPIVAMTANAMASDKEACLEAGMNDHVPKPFELAMLVKTLLKWRAVQPALADEWPSAKGQGQHAPVLSEPKPLAADANAWPDDVNAAAALARLGQHQGLYKRLLEQFAVQLAQTRVQLQQPAASHNAQRSLFHALKGSALSVGADTLARKAAAAEIHHQEAAESGAALEGTCAPDQQALEALARTERSIAEWLTRLHVVLSSESNTGWPDAQETNHMLTLLQGSDMEALALIDAWCQRFPHLVSDARWRVLIDRLNAMDFEGAAAVLAALTESDICS